jgi:threonine dehydratase
MAALPLARERRDAAEAIVASGLSRTPLVRASGLSSELGCEVRLKLECWQLTRSFKVRGAIAAVQRTPQNKTIVTASAGNHGLGIAFACSRLRRAAQIFVPQDTDPAKLGALRAFGGQIEIRVVDGSYDDTEVAGREAAAGPDHVFISSYNDDRVIAGQSTVAAEALDQWPEADAVVVPVGGGGLLAGTALSCSEFDVAAWGVEPDRSPAMTASLSAGRITRVGEEEVTVAQGLVGNLDADSVTFPLVRDHAAGTLVANEDEILDGVARIYIEEGIVIEPSAAAGIPRLPEVRDTGASRIICVLTGSNVSPTMHFNIVATRPTKIG